MLRIAPSEIAWPGPTIILRIDAAVDTIALAKLAIRMDLEMSSRV
jgi:hypothetical protein